MAPPQSCRQSGDPPRRLQSETPDMLSIARIWYWLIHVPYLGAALVVLLLWFFFVRGRAKGRR